MREILKAFFHQPPPPQSTIHTMDLVWLKEPLLGDQLSQFAECVNRKHKKVVKLFALNCAHCLGKF